MYEFIEAEKAVFSVQAMCRVLGVTRSGYYRWRSARVCVRRRTDQKLAARIRAIHSEHRGRYGSPRIQHELRRQGMRVARKRVARLMAANGLQGRVPRRYRHTTNSRHTHAIAPNVVARNFTATAPNQTWVGDITYLPVTEGWLFLAVLIDVYSRRVVGWSLSENIDTQLALDALAMAAVQRRPAAGLVHHTDRDCRYASDDYQTALKSVGATPSMSRKGNCWDNAVAESFFATLEKEVFDQLPVQPRDRTRALVAHYIERYYNEKRLHSYLNYRSPITYERMAAN